MTVNHNTIGNEKKRNLYLYGTIISGIISAISLLVFLRPFLDSSLFKNMSLQFVSMFGFGIFGNLARWLFQQYKRLNAGIKGEVKTQKILSSLPSQYQVLSNISIEFDGKKSEIDNLILSQKGIVIVETKSYKGVLEGKEDDLDWKYTKISSGGNQYISTVKNPLKQVKRQTYILSKILKENGISCWIDAFVFILDGKCYVSSENIFMDERNLVNRVILSGKDNALSDVDIIKIKSILKKQQ